MLVIRPEQMNALQLYRDGPFVKWMVGYLRSSAGEHVAGLDDDTLEARIRVGIARARRHGLGVEMVVAEFVEAMFTRAPNFDDHPRVRALLEQDGIDPEARMGVMHAGITEQEWQEIHERRDDTVWVRG